LAPLISTAVWMKVSFLEVITQSRLIINKLNFPKHNAHLNNI
jgi:hypothetical protein